MSGKSGNDYDSEPVVYCARCYSLKVGREDSLGLEYCMDCGSSDMLSSTIDEWERLYEKRYGRKYVNRTSDPKRAELYRKTVEQLKTMVYQSDRWQSVIHALYPRFPGGLNRAESVLLLFDRLARDGRMDDLRKVLLRTY